MRNGMYFDRNDNYLQVRFFRAKQLVWFSINYAFVIGAVILVAGIIAKLTGIEFRDIAASFALAIATFNLVSRRP